MMFIPTPVSASPFDFDGERHRLKRYILMIIRGLSKFGSPTRGNRDIA